LLSASFGFVFEEADSDSPQLFDSAIKEALDAVAATVATLSSPDILDFYNTLENIDQRVFGAIRNFVNILAKN
jgi:hypothetical protein